MALNLDPVTGLPKNYNLGLGGVGGDLLAAGQPFGGYTPFAQTGSPGAAVGRSAAGTPGASNPFANIDFQGLINNDPLFQQLGKDLTAQGIADASSRDQSVNRALVQFGEIPTGDALSQIQQLFGNQLSIDPTTAQLAQKNTQAGLSTVARLEKALKDARRAKVNELAARGALRSGETGHQLNELQQEYTTAQYDARQKLTDMLAGVQAGYAQAERGRTSARAQGLSDAAGRQLSLILAQLQAGLVPGAQQQAPPPGTINAPQQEMIHAGPLPGSTNVGNLSGSNQLHKPSAAELRRLLRG